ncbi:cell division suppressor protein YneA [Caloranaerobacter azorensis]|uniref:LysM peptidoglycan-binding domain-containing protein n=1 Tax=Caloranaerobacter azorensis TaxID=116090 RepID=A0A6P1YB91_9FIRM|nr:LysM peptidoglycan-binding domain-containing protein [Caloranaerobacter azorensis]QIB26128.1 LysM peptidoglycan-binding domain-containing protein [Caloranaerobacter azorensis]
MKVKIVNRTRFITFLVIFITLILIFVSTLFKIGKAYSVTYSQYINVEVKAGDTLWDIAKRNNSGREDIRKLVYKIMKLNNLDTAKIKPGDIIKVPIYIKDR